MGLGARESIPRPSGGPFATSSSRHDLHDGEELPAVLDPLELVLAFVLEAVSRARHEVAHRARDQHLAGRRGRQDPRRDVDPDPGDVVAEQLDLAGVDTCPQREPDAAGPLEQLAGRVDRS